MYSKETAYVIGHGRTGSENAITEQFKVFFIGFIIDKTTDEVVDLGCSVTVSKTEEFIQSIFLGVKFDRFYKSVEEEISLRYFGSSQKAIQIAYKDALKKYLDLKHGGKI